MNKLLEKKGLLGAFMDSYDDFLVFEPNDVDLLKEFIFEVVGFNVTAHWERSWNLNKRTSVMFLPFFELVLDKVSAAIQI